MYSIPNPRRARESPSQCAHASYSSPGGLTLGIRTRSAVNATISSVRPSTAAAIRSIVTLSTMRYCSGMKRLGLSFACALTIAGLKPCATCVAMAQGANPVKHTLTPVAQGAIPVKQTFTPVAQGVNPVKHTFTPVAQGVNPVKHTFTPVAQGFSPANTTLTAVDGIKVGSFTLPGGTTGCTVILVDGEGVPGGVAQRGGAPGTRETDLLNPLNMVDKVNAIVLSGGSAFGLDAASGTSKWLEEHHIGWGVRVAKGPIVPAAILFDLPVGNNATNHPGADCGYKAVEAATTAAVSMGTVGAGAGATVGKMGGPGSSMKGGLGSAALRMPNGLVVAAIVAVNAAGDILDPDTGKVIAGARKADGTFADARELLRSGAMMQRRGTAAR